MAFSVNTGALGGLALFLDRRDSDLAGARVYLAAHTRLRYGYGLVNVLGNHERVATDISRYLEELSDRFARPLSVRIGAVIHAYDTADARSAERADASLPALHAEPAPSALRAGESPIGPGIFDDVAVPADLLVTPGDHLGDMPYQPSWFDLLSPTSMGRDAIWKVTTIAADAGIIDRPVDPLEVITRPFVGDWAGVLRCAEVFDHLSAMLLASAGDTAQAASAVPAAWTGNAAAGAIGHLHGFQAAQTSAVTILDLIAAEYRQVAAGVADNAKLMEALVTTVVDQACDTALDSATMGVLDLYDVSTKVRDVVKGVQAAIQVANNVSDLVSAGFAIADDAGRRLGVLARIAEMPAMLVAGPVITTGLTNPTRRVTRPVRQDRGWNTPAVHAS